MTQTYFGTFRKLVVWQRAKELTKAIYRLTKQFPKEERFGLCIQMQRAAVSVMSNIAEGNQRKGRADQLHFLNIATSSLTELDNQSELAHELGYIAKTDYGLLIELINKTAYLLLRFMDGVKHPKSLNSLNGPNSPKEGFSLVELIVVISIISVLSVTTVVAFNVFGEALKAKEVAGVITDKIKEAELLVLKGDYQKIEVHFFENYLVMAQTPEGAALNLELGGECNENGEGHFVTSAGTGSLQKKDEDSDALGISSFANLPMPPNKNQICAPFKGAEEAEWRYQLVQGDDVSSLIRFVHFNIDSNFTLGVAVGKSYRLAIEAPYAKKELYVDGDSETATTTLTIQNNGDVTNETVTLQS